MDAIFTHKKSIADVLLRARAWRLGSRAGLRPSYRGGLRGALLQPREEADRGPRVGVGGRRKTASRVLTLTVGKGEGQRVEGARPGGSKPPKARPGPGTRTLPSPLPPSERRRLRPGKLALPSPVAQVQPLGTRRRGNPKGGPPPQAPPPKLPRPRQRPGACPWPAPSAWVGNPGPGSLALPGNGGGMVPAPPAAPCFPLAAAAGRGPASPRGPQLPPRTMEPQERSRRGRAGRPPGPGSRRRCVCGGGRALARGSGPGPRPLGA